MTQPSGLEDLGREVRDLVNDLQRTDGRVGEVDQRVTDLTGELNARLNELTDATRAHTTWIGDARPQLAQVREEVDHHFEVLGEHQGALVELADHVKELLKEMPRQPKYPPICWLTLTAAKAAHVWRDLADWVEAVLVGRYSANRGDLLDCWPLHPGAVEELTWLHTAWRHAYLSTAGAVPAAEWHTRWRPDALQNVRAAIAREGDVRRATEKCSPGSHYGKRAPVVDPTAQPEPSPANGHAHNGARPSAATATLPVPTAARIAGAGRLPTADLAERRYWQPHLDEAREQDLAARLAREAEQEATDPDHPERPPPDD